MNELIFLLIMVLLPRQGNKKENPFDILRNDPPFVTYMKLTSGNAKDESTQQENYRLQALATVDSYIGKYKEAKECFARFDSITHQNRGIPIAGLDTDRVLNADSTILQQAKQHKVIAFNEEHHVPMDRAIVYHYLPMLAKLGYKYLAVEALSNLDSTVLKRGYPVNKLTGVYTNEPINGNLIRYAISLGYRLIAYDYGWDNAWGKREEIQAQHIAEQYNPGKGKLVILAGYGHICESPSARMMGSFLEKDLNEDLLTIKLTRSGDYPSQLDTSFVKPVVIPFRVKQYYDYQYFVPPAYKKMLTYNIPRWYQKYMGFQLRTINLSKEFPDKFASLHTSYLVCLTNPKENNGVPLYQYLEISKQQDITLPFPYKGSYQLTIENSDGRWAKKISFHRR